MLTFSPSDFNSFIKTLNEMYPEFENTYTLASIVRLCIDNSEYLSSELIKLGRVT